MRVMLGVNCLGKKTQARLTVTIHSDSLNMSKATSPQLFSRSSVHLISGVNCFEKNYQAQLTGTIHSGPHNMHRATSTQLFSLYSVHLISGLNCLGKNTQAQLQVTIHLGSPSMKKATLPQVFSRKLFGEEHSSTANSYHSIGVAKHEQGDFTLAIQPKQRALDIRRKRFGEEHSSTADSYFSRGHRTCTGQVYLSCIVYTAFA